MATRPRTTGAEPEPIGVERLELGVITVPIRGVTPLIVNRFDEKAKAMMLADQQGKKKAGREPKDPDKDFQRSRYFLPTGEDGFPAVGFKAAMINAASHYPKLTKVALKQAIFVEGHGPEQLVIIRGVATMREDTVRLSGSTADLRYRAAYFPWTAELEVRFVASTLTAGTVVNLIDAGGLGGVGEWRPSAPRSYTGSFGRFEVVGDA